MGAGIEEGESKPCRSYTQLEVNDESECLISNRPQTRTGTADERRDQNDENYSQPVKYCSPILDGTRLLDNEKCVVTRDEWHRLHVVGTLQQARGTQAFVLAFNSKTLVLVNPIRLQEALKSCSSAPAVSSFDLCTPELIRQEVCHFLEARCCNDNVIDLHTLYCPHRKPIFVKFYSLNKT